MLWKKYDCAIEEFFNYKIATFWKTFIQVKVFIKKLNDLLHLNVFKVFFYARVRVHRDFFNKKKWEKTMEV